MKNIIIAAVCGTILLTACDEKAINIIQEKELELNQNDRALITAMNQFTVKLFDEVKNAEDENKNLLLSPYSAHVALSLIANGAEGDTQQAMTQTLGYAGWPMQDVNASQQKLIEGLPLVSLKNELSIANSMWINDGFQIVPDFLNTSDEYYLARASAIPFVNPQAAQTINSWVKEQTKGKIEDIIEEVNADDLLYVLNAIYFKGVWADKFKAELTKAEDFVKADGSLVRAGFMRNTTDYKVFSVQGVDAVEIPYADDKFSMVLVRNNADEWNNDIDLRSIMEQSANNKRKIELILPKFTFSFERVLNNDLTNLGMGLVFDDGADFSKIIADKPAKISIVKQKAFIEVNEEGTEAAAVTSVGMQVTSAPIIPTMKFDRPFLFFIKENSSGLILFIGLVNDPTEQG